MISLGFMVLTCVDLTVTSFHGKQFHTYQSNTISSAMSFPCFNVFLTQEDDLIYFNALLLVCMTKILVLSPRHVSTKVFSCLLIQYGTSGRNISNSRQTFSVTESSCILCPVLLKS